MSGEPWSKFFWSDYDADEGLRMCSLAAQGLWMRMLCLMARATPKGELRVGSQPCTAADLSRVTGETEETVAELLGELERRGVFSRNRAGVIYSRRLRKDAELSKKRAKAGAIGASVTNLKTKGNQDLPRQNADKARGKTAAPEARSQKPDTKPPPVVQIPRDLAAVLEAGQFVSPPPDAALLKAWYEAGARLEEDIIPVVKRVAAEVLERTRRGPFKLQLFDQAVRAKVDADARELRHLNRIIEEGRREQAAAGG